MDDNKYNQIINILVLVAVACVLSIDYLGTYKLVALGIGLCASLLGVILYFQRSWNMSGVWKALPTRDIIDIADIPEKSYIASQYMVCADNIETLMLESQRLHQEVISNLLVQLEKSNWETESAKRLWMTLDYSMSPGGTGNSPSFGVGLSLDGRLVTRRSASKHAKPKTPLSSQTWAFPIHN